MHVNFDTNASHQKKAMPWIGIGIISESNANGYPQIIVH
jgi:hypothetical protein